MKMYIKKEGCENINNKFKIIILLLVFITMIISGYCFAKYDTSKEVIKKSKIAVPVLEIEGKETAKISEINNVGYYDFIVKNYNENNISDISQNYYIEIISNADESVGFELYKGEEKIDLINKKTTNFFIEGSKELKHSYRLKVSYDKNKSTLENDILEDVQIKVHSEQSKT